MDMFIIFIVGIIILLYGIALFLLPFMVLRISNTLIEINKRLQRIENELGKWYIKS